MRGPYKAFYFYVRCRELLYVDLELAYAIQVWCFPGGSAGLPHECMKRLC